MDTKQKTVFILGATGSIGASALRLIRAEPHKFRLVGITAYRSIDTICNIYQEFQPNFIHMMDKESASQLQRKCPSAQVSGGMDDLIELLSIHQFDIVLGAMVGMVGLLPAIAVLKNNGLLALANKESLVCGGKIIAETLKEHPAAKLIPVDSEHAAIHQCLRGENRQTIRRIILTASGGACRHLSCTDLNTVSLAQVMQHPNWSMGPKITIDSATLMNKGLEVIEAHWLFNIPYEQIEVVIHPQSIIHSMVEFYDGSVISQMSAHDMVLPIQQAFSYPKREKHELFTPLNFPDIGQLSFAKPDTQKFPCLELAYNAGRQGGLAPTFLNAANEIAVSAFIEGKIGFPHIPKICTQVLNAAPSCIAPQLSDILNADYEGRQRSLELIENLDQGRS